MNNYENIFLNYDAVRSKKNRKIKRISIIASVIIGILLITYTLLYFFSSSSLNFKIRDKESSSILYSDAQNWEENGNAQNAAAIASDAANSATPTVSPTPDVTPDPNGIGITQTETSLLTPVPVQTRPPITEGLFMTREANFIDGGVVINDNSYYSPTLSIEIYNFYKYESKIFVADVHIKSMDNFVPVFAGNEFDGGYQSTSDMAEEHNAILAINSDSATAADYGIIVRYGEIYRDILAGDHMAMFDYGVMKTYPSRNISAEFLLKRGAVHVFCFGPRLLNDEGKAYTFDYSQYAHNSKKHPRTAIGMIDAYHYVVVVADGREEGYSEGLTLEELSQLMYDLNCVTAYNLDGGGSSTMVFMDELVNRPEGGTDEREIDSAILFKETAFVE